MRCPQCEAPWNDAECMSCGFKPPTEEEMIDTLLSAGDDLHNWELGHDSIIIHEDFFINVYGQKVKADGRELGSKPDEDIIWYRDLFPKTPLLAIDMNRDFIAAGDTVLVYNKVIALVVLVTKHRDLVVQIHGNWYLCFSYNVAVDRLVAL